MTAEADKFQISLTAAEIDLAVGALAKAPYEVSSKLIHNILLQYVNEKNKRDAAERHRAHSEVGDQLSGDQD